MSSEPTTTKEEDSSSPEERIQWLRDHGIEVETPEDRIAKKQATVNAISLKEGDAGTRTFKYVLIPAGMTDPVKQLTAVVKEGKRKKDALPDLLGYHFTNGTVDKEALKHTAVKQMSQASDSPMDMSKLTPELLANVGGEAEAFKLSNNVSLYLDAVGALKHLPINFRAANLAEQCGYGSGVAFHGDIFIGRAETSSDTSINNVDFLIDDVNPTAKWVSTAFDENMRRQASENRPGIDAEELSTRGGDGEGYTWTQDPADVEVTVPTPSGIKGSQIKVKFTSTHLTIAVTGGLDTKLKLYAKVCGDGCSWSLSDGNLVISMEKQSEGETWGALIRE